MHLTLAAISHLCSFSVATDALQAAETAKEAEYKKIEAELRACQDSIATRDAEIALLQQQMTNRPRQVGSAYCCDAVRNVCNCLES